MPGDDTTSALKDARAVQSSLIAWYEDRAREVPWRDIRDPYAILIAEVMSQQTQLERVGPAWNTFVERWPTVDALARASRADVIAFWTTHRLGYNRRAAYLHEAATKISGEWDGEIPPDVVRLQSLKGVGPYTANAVVSIAFDVPEPVVDTNVKRVLFRFFGLDEASSPAYAELADTMLSDERPADWNNAMMDLGALVCTPTPACDAEPCPWRQWCVAYTSGDFLTPDAPTQATFEGSRRAFRGQIVNVLAHEGPLPLDELGHRVRPDDVDAGDEGRAWLEALLEDLSSDGLITVKGSSEDNRSVGLAEVSDQA